MDNYTIRIAKPEDASALLAIYKPYVEETAITFEYEVPSLEEFEGRIRKTLSRYPYLVAEREDGEILGYAYASVFKDRAAYDWSVETSIYIQMDQRGRGIGKKLYENLESILSRQHVLNVNACIAYARPENTHLDNSSVFFHEKLGYTMVGTFHDSGYKFGEWYDMVWMEKMLGEHKGTNKPFLSFPEL
ncbi:MAG: N-acetyltransferase [Spirochaetales bacterium]|nr:N-acetyltransferase [Candidatus Physcosoma equi]